MFLAGIFAAAFAFEVVYDNGTKKYFQNLNKGVRFFLLSFRSFVLLSFACH